MAIGSDDSIKEIICRYGEEILRSDSFRSELGFIQHGVINCYEHSLAVTYVSVWLAKKVWHNRVDMKSIVRAGLLHDYFLYDWHEDAVWHSLHGYHHARRAMQNARRDFNINKKEQQIIYRHMFPLNITRLPFFREAVIVCLADKICALTETITKSNYKPVLTERFISMC